MLQVWYAHPVIMSEAPSVPECQFGEIRLGSDVDS